MSKSKIPENLILGAAQGVDGITKLLTDGLEWPLPDHLDSVPLIEWSPEQLGLDAQQLGKLTSIHQVPKLNSQQPFGVFILEFQGGRLPIGALRKVLDQLVHKQRRRKSGAASQWDLGDLIFFCHSSEAGGSIHVAAWNNTTKRPELRAISWSTNPTATRLELLQRHTLPDLIWPDDVVAVDQWRDQWQSAFSSGYRQGVRTAAQLSQRMAEVATDIRNEISDLLRVELPTGPMRSLLSDLQQRLDASLNEDTFGDVIAQTLVYGLLSARVSHPEQFMAAEGRALIDFENPFLDAIYQVIRTSAEDSLDLDQLGLNDLAHTLGETDTDALLADFGAADHRDDPVIYLYEEFLNKYDQAQRHRLGAYYTPIPVVDTIIKLCDESLKRVAGLKDGISDSITLGQMYENESLSLSDGADPHEPVLQMLDPATGTGTFLLRWLHHLKQTKPKELGAVVKRIAAIELSMASYAVAHLKTGLELPSEIREKTRLPIYLSDTLSGPRPQHLTGLEDPIAEETEVANDIKFQRRTSLIIGNPPYDRITRDEGGGWILNPQPGQPNIFADVLDPAIKHTIFSYTASLYNLYVYYWRWAIWKAFEQNATGPASVCFITASSWLEGPGFLGLRKIARELADEISVVDLGGNNRGGSRDENIFGIETPVAIVCLTRRSTSDRQTPASVRYLSITGTRAEKLDQLTSFDPSAAAWTAVSGDWFDPLKPPAGADDWLLHPLLTDLFPWQQPGCMYNRTWPIAPHPDLLAKRWERLLEAEDAEERQRCFVPGSSGRDIHTAVAGYKRLVDETPGAEHQPVVPYGYRSFDTQWTFDDPRVANLDRPSLWASLSDQQMFLVTTSTQAVTAGPAATLFTAVPDKHAYNGRGGKDVFPLYRDAFLTPNCSRDLLLTLSTLIKSDPKTAEDLFAYCYGILAGSDYTERFRLELETPGSRIPLTRNGSLFQRMTQHGKALASLNTQGTRFSSYFISPDEYQPYWHREPTKPPANTRDFTYEEAGETLLVGDGLLVGLPANVWEFSVSGMQVLRKWLSYRTASGAGRAASSSSPLDQIRPTEWYPEWSQELVDLVATLAANLELMREGSTILDEILEAPLITASELPMPPEASRKAPSARRGPRDSCGTLI